MNPHGGNVYWLSLVFLLKVFLFLFQIDCIIQKQMHIMSEKQKKYAKYAEQFQRTAEMVTVLNRIQDTMNDIIPKMETLNKMLPPGEQLEPFQMKDPGQT